MSCVSDINQRFFFFAKGHGVVTPSKNDLSTITLVFQELNAWGKLQERYTKLRQVDVRSSIPGDASTLSDPWLPIGTESQKCFVGRQSLYAAVDRFKNVQVKETLLGHVRAYFEPWCPPFLPLAQTTPLFAPFTSEKNRKDISALVERGYKITTAACPKLCIVASKILYTGKTKIHRKIIVLYPPESKPRVSTKECRDENGEELCLNREGYWMRKLPGALPYLSRFECVRRGVGNESLRKEEKTPINKHALISEYFDQGNCNDYLNGLGEGNTIDLRLRLVLQTAEALSSLHDISLIHGDLKTTNILVHIVDGAPCIALCDFSLMAEFGVHMKGSFGTFPPPEGVFQEKKSEKSSGDQASADSVCATPAVDCWAFGILLCCLFRKNLIDLDSFVHTQTREKILQARNNLLASLSPSGSSFIDDLIRGLLDEEPSRRPTMLEAISLLRVASFYPEFDKNSSMHK